MRFDSDLLVSGTLVIPSGIITESLTVSGVPVPLAGGGGSGTITDINTTATGPSVTITGAAGINTITEGNTITISGAGQFSPGFRGARLTTSSGVSFTSGAVQDMPWDTITYDTDGFFDPSLPSQMTIPANVRKVQVVVGGVWESTTVDGERLIFVSRNGTTVGNMGIDQPNASNGTARNVTLQATTYPFEVEEGDVVTVSLRQETLATLDILSSEGTTFSLWVVDPAPIPGFTAKNEFFGALITTSTGVAIPNNSSRTMIWDTEVYDQGNWFDNPTRDDVFIVPNGLGISKVRCTANIAWENQNPPGTERRIVGIQKNGSPVLGGGIIDYVAGGTGNFAARVNVVTGPIEVVPGDEFRVRVNHQEGSDLDVAATNDTWFSIEALEFTSQIDLDSVTALSGTFTESLTISGVPVSTGTGGGSANTLQDAYDNGDGTISTTGGKPLELTGTGELLAVTGTFTEGLTVGSSSTVIDDKSIVTATGTFQNLTVSGIPVSLAHLVGGAPAQYSVLQLGANFTTGGTSAVFIDDWDIEAVNRGGFTSTPDGFIVPAGVTHVRVGCQLQWGGDAGAHRITVFVNDDPPSIRAQTSENSDTGTGIAAFVQRLWSFAPFEVSEGNLVKLRVTTGGSSDTVTASVNSYFYIEDATPGSTFVDNLTVTSGTFTQSLTISGVPVSTGTGGGGSSSIDDINGIDSGSVTVTGVGGVSTLTQGNTITVSGAVANIPFRGAAIATSSGIDADNSALLIVPFDTTIYDTDGFHDEDVSHLRIPDGVTKARFSCAIIWDDSGDNDSTDRLYAVDGYASPSDNNILQRALLVREPSLAAGASDDTAHVYTTGVIPVEGGQYYRLRVRQRSGTTKTIVAGTGVQQFNTHFAVQVVEDDTGVSLNDFTAISGSFSESLTVSGIPVSLGGGGASTLQDAYDNGDGIITTAGGKPFELDGTGELLAVTGTFTAGLTVGTASTIIKDGSVTTATGTFTGDIVVSGTSNLIGTVTLGNIVSGAATTYQTDDTQFATSSSSFVDTGFETEVLLTGANLVLFAASAGSDASSSRQLSLRATFGGSTIAEVSKIATTLITDAAGVGLSGFKVVTGDGVSTFKYQARNDTGANITVGRQHAIAIPFGNMGLTEGVDYFQGDDGDSSTEITSTSFSTLFSISPTLPESGDYLVFGYVEGENNGSGAVFKFRHNSSDISGEHQVVPGGSRFASAPFVRLLTGLSAGANTFDIQGREVNGTTFYRRARLCVIKASSFDQITGSRKTTDVTANSSTYVQVDTINYTPNSPEKVLFLANTISSIDGTGGAPGVAFKITDVTGATDYLVDHGPSDLNSVSSKEGAFHFVQLENVSATNVFSLSIADLGNGGQVVRTEEDTLIVWGLTPTAGGISQTVVQEAQINTPTLNANTGVFSTGLTVSGTPVLDGIPNPLTVESGTFETLTTVTGTFTESLTVSGAAVNTKSLADQMLHATVSTTSGVNFDNAEVTPMIWDVAINDVGDWFDPANPSRLTVPDGVQLAQFHAGFRFADDSAGTRRLFIVRNGDVSFPTPAEGFPGPIPGAVILDANANAAGNLMQVFSPTVLVSGGDYYELHVFQGSGGVMSAPDVFRYDTFFSVTAWK